MSKEKEYNAKNILKTVKIAGKNGSKILPGDWRTSPDQLVMNLEQAKDCVNRGFFVWVCIDSNRTVYLNKRNMDTEIEKIIIDYNLNHSY